MKSKLFCSAVKKENTVIGVKKLEGKSHAASFFHYFFVVLESDASWRKMGQKHAPQVTFLCYERASEHQKCSVPGSGHKSQHLQYSLTQCISNSSCMRAVLLYRISNAMVKRNGVRSPSKSCGRALWEFRRTKGGVLIYGFTKSMHAPHSLCCCKANNTKKENKGRVGLRSETKPERKMQPVLLCVFVCAAFMVRSRTFVMLKP
jgi:hypothetical protein